MAKGKEKTIIVWQPKVTPIGKKGKKYVYKITRYKGCFLLKGNAFGNSDTFIFKKTKCPKR